jgi:hypothetical protein
MCSIRFNARLDTSHHESLHPLIDGGAIAVSLTGIHSAMVKCLFLCQQELHTQWCSGVPTGKHPEDSSQASVEAMQLVLLYLSIGYCRSYREHLAQHGCNVPEHHHTCTVLCSYNSQMKCSQVDYFLVLVFGTRAQN